MTSYDKNKFAFDWLGVTQYHKAGYRGKGIKILVYDWDFVVSGTTMKNNIVPIANSGLARSRFNGKWEDHGMNTCSIIHQIAPEAEIHFAAIQHMSIYKMIEYARDNKMDITNLSMMMPSPRTIGKVAQECVDMGLLLFAAAGNSGGEGVTWPASKATFTAVGAGFVNQITGEPGRAIYSSIGEELVVMGYTGLDAEYFGGTFKRYTGTSCACPALVATIALYINAHGKLNTSQARDMFEKECVDMHTPGMDTQTGYGMFRLPKLEGDDGEMKEKEIVLMIDNPIMTVNGVRVKMDTEPIIHNGRTMVPVSFIAREFGLDVQWNPQTREVTIRG